MIIITTGTDHGLSEGQYVKIDTENQIMQISTACPGTTTMEISEPIEKIDPRSGKKKAQWKMEKSRRYGKK